MEKEIQFTERILTPRAVKAVQQLGAYTARSLSLREFKEFVTDGLVYELKAYVLSEQVGSKTLEFREAPSYASSRHAFLDSLPQHSFRRRFLPFLWGIDPTQSMSTVKVHTITVQRWSTYPRAEIIPKELGQPVLFQEVSHFDDVR